MTKPEFNADALIDALTDALVEQYAEWRDLSDEFAFWLRAQRKLGYHEGHFCYPIFGVGGVIIGAQVFVPEQKRLFTIGALAGNMIPVVLGVPHAAKFIVTSESAHDLFSVADRSDLWKNPDYAWVASRGATGYEKFNDVPWRRSENGQKNGDTPSPARVIRLRQRETKKDDNGFTANDRWANATTAIIGLPYTDLWPAEGYKDWNDLNRTGFARDHLLRLIDEQRDAEAVTPEPAEEPDDTEWFTVDDLLAFDRKNDPKSVIGNRWLCRGDSLILQGYTGIGKSALLVQWGICWAVGRPLHDCIHPTRRGESFKVLYIQAENNKGDLAIPTQDVIASLKLNPAEIEKLKQNWIPGRQAGKCGAKAFGAYVRRLVKRYKPDFVIFDPLLSYFGNNISNQEAASEFFRMHLQPIQNETGVILVFAHHYGKPPKQGEERTGPSFMAGLGSVDIFGWARELVDLIPEPEKCLYQLKFGKRGELAGIVDENGNPLTELIIKRGSVEKRYWSRDKDHSTQQDLQDTRDRNKLTKVQAFIEKHETVIAADLRVNAKEFDINENKVGGYADRLAKGELKDARKIYSFIHKVKDRPGTKPKIYSIFPKPEGEEPIEVKVIGQQKFNASWTSNYD